MPARRLGLSPAVSPTSADEPGTLADGPDPLADGLNPLADGLTAIRTEFEVHDDFSPEVRLAAARAVASRRLPELDRTDLDLVTIDPVGARDLDQALHIARGETDSGGYVVSYAIADVASFVTAGDLIDMEAHRRGQTLYAPDHRTPLHPPTLSEDAASLLADRVRPALLWTLTLDAYGKTIDAQVERARVRSREQLTYSQAQAEIDGAHPRQTLALLAEVGLLREQRERDRGGVSLQIPDQEIDSENGVWRLQFRTPLPVEGWNAQISLLTGMAAAHIMMYGQVGILRTLPPAEATSLRRLRQTAKALRIHWPAELDYPELVRSLDPAEPAEAAMLNACTTLFRGAGYRAFSGGIPADVEHAALAVEYAHTTAPLRRLVDRYVGEICVALCADAPVPDWVMAALDDLPAEMGASQRFAKAYERAIINVAEACLLADRVGQIFTGTVTEVHESKTRGTVVVAEPAVEATIRGCDLPLGLEVQVRLVAADPALRTVEFALLE